MSTTAQALAPDLVVALKRLKLSRVRALAPEVLQTAKTQRWSPEELLRTLVEAEITARDEANHTARLKTAGFPVTKSLEEFKVAQSSIPQATRGGDFSWPPAGTLRWPWATGNGLA